MRTPLLITTLLAASSAFADPGLTEDQLPPLQYKTLADNPHAAHSICHSQLWRIDPSCSSIRTNEQNTFQALALIGPQETIVRLDGVAKLGHRDVYSTANVTGGAWDTTYSARVWTNRFKPILSSVAPGTSLHPEWEGHDSVNSCDEYGYKRYYQANRQLDSINALVSSNRYIEALDVALTGALPTGTTKGFWGVSSPTIVDYESKSVRAFNTDFSGATKPGLTAPVNRNPFWGNDTPLISSLPSTGEAWEDHLDAALHLSASRSSDQTHDTWDYANKIRQNLVPEAAQIKQLSPSERDDIARRIQRMRKAQRVAAREFMKCTYETFRAQTASTTQYPNGQTFEEWAHAVIDPGTIDPIDYDELALQSRLVDDVQSASTLTGLLSTSITTKDLSGTFARTGFGSALRTLSSINATALSSAVSATKYTFKSGSWNRCNGAYYEVARLLVEEYDRVDHGCLGAGNKCEFSIPAFIDDVSDKLNTLIADVDVAKDLCTSYLGTNFDGQSKVPTENRKTLSLFEAWFKDRKQTIDAAIRSAPRNSSLPNSIGDRRTGAGYWGDASRFGAGYSYESEWGVNVIQKAKRSVTNPVTKQVTSELYACRLGGQIEGTMSAWVDIFKARENLIDAGLTSHTVQTDASLDDTEKQVYFDAHVTLLGIDVYQSPDDKLIPSSFTKNNDDHFDITLVKTTIILGFIPVTISAGFGFDYGYNLHATFEQSGCQPSPTLGLWGNVTPHAAAEAFVEAYVDLFVVGAGVKGTLTLVKAELPFRANLKVTQDAAGYNVSASSSLYLHLTELSGSLSFIVKVLEITVWEHELFHWAGIRQDIELWKANVTFPFIAYDQLATLPKPQ